MWTFWDVSGEDGVNQPGDDKKNRQVKKYAEGWRAENRLASGRSWMDVWLDMRPPDGQTDYDCILLSTHSLSLGSSVWCLIGVWSGCLYFFWDLVLLWDVRFILMVFNELSSNQQKLSHSNKIPQCFPVWFVIVFFDSIFCLQNCYQFCILLFSFVPYGHGTEYVFCQL